MTARQERAFNCRAARRPLSCFTEADCCLCLFSHKSWSGCLQCPVDTYSLSGMQTCFKCDKGTDTRGKKGALSCDKTLVMPVACLHIVRTQKPCTHVAP